MESIGPLLQERGPNGRNSLEGRGLSDWHVVFVVDGTGIPANAHVKRNTAGATEQCFIAETVAGAIGEAFIAGAEDQPVITAAAAARAGEGYETTDCYFPKRAL